MFDHLKRMFASSPSAELQQPFQDPVLGRVEWSDEDDAWRAVVPGRTSVALLIDGYPRVDEAQLALAREIARAFEAFEEAVLSTLEAELRNFHPRFRDEILRLRIESVWFRSGPSPSGMIYFDGGKDDRLWRCDYADGRAVNLGFDS